MRRYSALKAALGACACRKFDGDRYENGLPGLAAWAATLGAVLLGGAYAIYATSAL